MAEIEQQNWRQIEALNQRGGRCLSIVDLIEAGTIPVEMAAIGAAAVSCGSSMLTAAELGGTGKTTLMAALLAFMPPEEPIVTTDRPSVVSKVTEMPQDRPVWILAHEIGSGSWYGYIWDATVAAYFGLLKGRRRVVSCLHADTLPQLRNVLLGPPLNVDEEKLHRVGLVLFMRGFRDGVTLRRRVTTAYISDGARWHELCRYRPRQDDLDLLIEPDEAAELLSEVTDCAADKIRARIDRLGQFLRTIRPSGERDIGVIRQKFLNQFFA